MALSTRNVSNTPNDTAIQTVSFTATRTYTVGAGTEMLCVAARWEGSDSANLSISAVRWADNLGLNEEALTLIVYRGSAQTGEDVGVGTYRLVNPTARVGQIEVDYTITALSGADISSWSISALEVIGGVDTASPIGATNSAEGIAQNAELSLTSTVANSLILSSLAHYGGDTNPFTPAAGITAELADGDTGTSTGSDHGYWMGECLTTTVGTYAVGATGAVVDDYAVVAFEIKPAGGITGTLSQTQAADTASSAATVAVKGTLAATQAANTASGTATVSVTGTASATQAGDTLSASGAVAVKGSLSVTQAGDTLTGVIGEGAITGTAEITQAGDTVQATATVQDAAPEPQPEPVPSGGARYFTPPPVRKKRKQKPEAVPEPVPLTDIRSRVAEAMQADAALSQVEAEIKVLLDIQRRNEELAGIELRHLQNEEDAIALLLLAA